MNNPEPADPVTELDVMAASIAEQFNAYVRAGIPPIAVAIMLGTMMGTMGSQGQHGNDGP
jgi:uncharacterized membrane protein YadS